MIGIWAGAFVHTKNGWVEAQEVAVGDEVRVLNADGTGYEWSKVTDASMAFANCYAIQGQTSGARLTASGAARGSKIAFEALDGGVRKELCDFYEVGESLVCEIKVGSRPFSAGDVKNFGLFPVGGG